MKKAVNILIIMLVHQVMASAQCGINYKSILDKYCEGEYLIHQELDNKSGANASLILEKDNTYAVYLLNPSHSIPSFKLEGYGKLPLKDFKTEYNQKENYSVYIFTVNETGEYDFSLDFSTEERACVLMAIYLQNITHYVAGIYKNYKELKENKPSIEFNYQISTRMHGYGIFNASGKIPFYKLNVDRENGKSIGRVFGFCDGKNVFINENYPVLSSKTEFVRTEYLGKYFYFEDRGSATIFIGNVPATSYHLDQKILDINTGRVMSLSKKTLQGIIADDNELLTEFNSDPKKGKNLKEYLIKYLGRQDQNSR